MDLDTLQSVQSRERQTDSVQSLQSDFYTATAAFVGELRDRRARAAEVADDPFADPEVSRLSHDIETAEQTVEAIYERRVGKIVKLASLAAADMAVDDEGLTDEEQDLFETLVTAIESNRGRVMDVLDAGSASDGGSTTPDSGVAPDSDGVSAAAAMGEDAAADGRPEEPTQRDGGTSPAEAADASGASTNTASADRIDADATPDQIPPTEATEGRASAAESSGGASAPPDDPGSEEGRETADRGDPAADGGRIDRRTVQVTDEVGEIFGVDDRTYDLATGDVVTLPEANADILVDGDEAVPID